MAKLLSIDQPLVVRHAAAEAFEQRACDEACTLAALYAFNEIWEGKPALEAAPSSEELEQEYGVHPDLELKRRTLAELRDKTQQDYRNLLNTNPCKTREALTRNFSAEPAFIEYIQSKSGQC